MDKDAGNLCPRCGNRSLDIYSEEGADIQHGACCEECGLKGFFVNGKLVQMVTT
ncbi:MAG: hypothetical protein ABSF63_14775 [Candidatus Bathyarchaeia archaeon]